MRLSKDRLQDENNTYVGRTYRDAPNVDGYIFINTDEELLTEIL